MRKSRLSAVILLLVLIAATASARRRQQSASTATFIPPAEPGVIFAVFDYQRVQGRAQSTPVLVDWAGVQRQIIAPSPYESCATASPAGFVIRLRHPQPTTAPLTITTSGTILRGPYQGDPPLELLHVCYRLVS